MKNMMLAGLMLFTLPLCAQEGTASKSPEYAVVSVRPTSEKSGDSMITATRNGFKATGTTVKFMIMDAYGLRKQDLISGLPKWAAETRYDIEAKMDPDIIEAQKNMTPKERFAAHRVLVQALLPDRFKLQAHMEEKEMPAYAMVQTKGGFKLKPLDSTDPEKTGAKLPNGMRGGMMMMSHNSITGQMITMDALAQNLGINLHRQVIDKSGVTGTYDLTLKFTPDDACATNGADTSDPSLFTALEEQLGLHLDSIEAKVEMVSVNHVETPGEDQ